MDLFRRIGTQKKKFKVQFFIGRLKFSSFRAGKIYIVIKRGDHKVKSQQKLQMSQDCKINFNKEILQVQATLYFDEKDKVYQEKTGQLSVVLLDEKDNKILLGDLVFDIAVYANSGQESVKENKKLQNSPKKIEGRIEFNVFVKYIGQGSESSADKVSDFFFGKNKEESQPEKGKQKAPRNDSKAKPQPEEKKKGKTKLIPQSQSEQSYDAEANMKQKQNLKHASKAQPQKSKGQDKNLAKQYQKNTKPQQSSNNYQSSKNYVMTSHKNDNNEKAYLTSENEEDNPQQSFYFDQPYAKDGKEKPLKDEKENNRGKKAAETNKQNPIQKLTKKPSKGQKPMHEDQGQQGEQQIATSEVEVMQIGHVFAKSQAQQVGKSKPLVKSQVTSLKDGPIPVKIRQKTRQQSPTKQTKTKEKSKHSEQIRKEVRQQERKKFEQTEQKIQQKQRKSIDKRKQIRPQEYRKQKEPVKVERKQEEFEFGKKMSQDWLDKKEPNQEAESDEEYDFMQKKPSEIQLSSGKEGLSKNWVNQAKDQKVIFSGSRQKQNKQSNKFKKSLIEQLLPPYSDKQKERPKRSWPIPSNDFQQLYNQNQSLKQIVKKQQSTIRQLQSQLSQSHQSLEELASQVHYYQSELKLKEDELEQQRNHTSKTMKSFGDDRLEVQKIQAELKAVEKLKNELIVQNSKLKDNYKKDFQQYEQILEEKQTSSLTRLNSLKADILKLKTDNSSLRAQLEQLSLEINIKNQQAMRLKSQLILSDKDSNQVKEALSNLKFKICTLLNEALSTGETTTIELLMDLNKH